MSPTRFEMSLPYVINRLDRIIHSRINHIFALTGINISMDQFLVLIYLWQEDGRNQQELAELTFKDKASISRIIDLLEKKHLVKRLPDPDDRRHKLVFLSEKGKDFQEKCVLGGMKSRAEAEKNIPPEDLQITTKTLLQMINNLEEGK
jgi:DNA-binding MarR family transcriptional regulator